MGPPTISAEQPFRYESASGAACRAKIANLFVPATFPPTMTFPSYLVLAQKSRCGAGFVEIANLRGFRHRSRFAERSRFIGSAYSPHGIQHPYMHCFVIHVFGCASRDH